MEQKSMVRIGDFSRISQVPVSTLRYYDDVGLLKPVKVDHFTGYRYYAFDQLPRVNRILALKDLGFSLEEIARLMGDDLPGVEMITSTVHKGPFITIGEAYHAIIQWLETNGFRINGPCREIYLHTPEPAANGVNQTDPNTVTEIQFPVVKV